MVSIASRGLALPDRGFFTECNDWRSNAAAAVLFLVNIYRVVNQRAGGR
jgi:hypothetical protein